MALFVIERNFAEQLELDPGGSRARSTTTTTTS